MQKAWTYIIANCVIAVLGVLAAVAWPNIVGPNAAPYVAIAISAANAVAHAVTGPGPAAGAAS